MVRDAVKKKLPDGVPKPGKFKLAGAAAEAGAAVETAAPPEPTAPAEPAAKGA